MAVKKELLPRLRQIISADNLLINYFAMVISSEGKLTKLMLNQNIPPTSLFTDCYYHPTFEKFCTIITLNCN